MACFCIMVWKMIEIVPNERAFFLDELNALVIADLHMGYEYVLRKEGITLPESEGVLLQRIKRLIHKYGAKKLIILGDVKHSIGEYRNVHLLEELNVTLYVAKGNHDGGLENLLNAKIYRAEGFRIGNYGFMHGHSWPAEDVMNARYVFMGHIHPEIELRDSMGKSHRYACHLVGTLTEKGKKIYTREPKIFVVAAFNPLVGSALVDPIGPLMKNKIIDNFEVYLLNGTYLGKMEALLH